MKSLRLKHYRVRPREPDDVRETWALGPDGSGLPLTDGPFVETTDLIAEHAYALSTVD
ncbi:hypothetical protein [Labedaea rhizosphaerae]|uniref:Uncharacterized protein n=1 Tax=Labedaea rhizosphaerae TaxID=598644 RepID=A0A4R6SEQ5_LABRH|nr:hypothetical protein [Labedaea rhizosphaerae]TDQ00203.1 hypothetical protein EV186_10264 [Labedaea rhizosphaerae]